MIEVQARSMIYTIRNLLMPQTENNVKRGGSMPLNTYRGLKFNFDMSISHTVGDERKQARSIVEVLIVGDQHAFVRSNDFSSPRELSQWDNVGNHDTCWIDSVESKLNSIYFAMCDSVDNKVAPAILRQQSWFSAFGPGVEYVEVQMGWDTERNEEHGSQYWRTIASCKRISHLEFAAYVYVR